MFLNFQSHVLRNKLYFLDFSIFAHAIKSTLERLFNFFYVLLIKIKCKIWSFFQNFEATVSPRNIFLAINYHNDFVTRQKKSCIFIYILFRVKKLFLTYNSKWCTNSKLVYINKTYIEKILRKTSIWVMRTIMIKHSR